MNTQEILQGLDALYAANKKSEAEKYMLKHLEEAISSKDNPVRITMLNELIGFYRDSSRIQESLNYCDQLKDFLDEEGLNETPHYFTSLLNIATAYRNAGMHEEALAIYFDVAQYYALAVPDKDLRMGGLCNNISVTCLEIERFDEAEDWAEKAVAALTGLEGAQGELAVAYSNLAAVYIENGEIEDAIEKLNLSVDILKNRPELNMQYAATLSHLASIYIKSEEYEKACDTYKETLERIEKSFGRNIPYAITCRNYAVALCKAGHPDEADKYNALADEIHSSLLK